ncbi:hypothetical protein HLP06_004713, partial [Shigella flexneri]|nr:hypothetical protein [Salmonella enterica]EFJ0488264.1 hypothetical protein [Escherichia coli]EFP9169823.1 hypothetical protein [Shigella sonnei]EFP9262917.1 hypothetical protein [Shigella flexneri]EFP9225153.1 hypothetical protein [Shigella sonnei]
TKGCLIANFATVPPMRCPVMEFPAKCQGRLYDLQRDMSINSKFNPILTQFTHGI